MAAWRSNGWTTSASWWSRSIQPSLSSSSWAWSWKDEPRSKESGRAPVNALGYLRVMFTVEDVDDTVSRLRRHGAELVGEVVQYKDAYRLCYIRGPEGILLGLAQELG